MKIPREIIEQYARWEPEIQKADQRIRHTPNGNGQSTINNPRAAAMRWAIGFAALDLSSLSEGDLSNLQYEIDCLRRFNMRPLPFPMLATKDSEWHRKTLQVFYLLRGETPQPPPLPTREAIDMVQKWLRTSLQIIIERRPGAPGVQCEGPRTVYTLQWEPLCQRWLSPLQVETAESLDQQFKAELFRLLQEHAEQLRACRCEDCRRAFLRDRRNQDFCSRPCQWRHAQRHRPNNPIPPERYGKRGRRPQVSPRKSTRGRRKGPKQ